MDSRAKQRLTGAVILVALFVLLVPELLTGPRTAGPPSDAQSEAGLRRYTIDLDAPSTTAQPMAPPANTAVALPPVAEPMSTTPAAAAPGEAAAPEVEAPTPAPLANHSAPASSPGDAVATPRAVSRPSSTQPAAAQPVPTPTEAPKPAVARPAQPGSFVVQLGSFGKRENAEHLVRDMTAKGFTAFVAPITSGGRELYRVRVGPTHDRASAEALAVELKRVGQSGSIVPIS